MILQEKLEKPYSDYTIREMICLKCDYCGIEFQRVKKSISKCNKYVSKDSCGIGKCKRDKKKEVNEVLRNDESYLKNQKENLEKQKQENILKYGVEYYTQTEEFKLKRKKTMVERFGVEEPLQNIDIQEKYKKTCENRYGVDNPAKVENFYDKVKKTNLKSYGYESAMSNPDVLEKRRKTCVIKFGKNSYTKTIEFWKNRKEKHKKLHGVEHPSQIKENREKAKETCQARYGESNYAKTIEFKKRFIKTNLERYGVPNPLFLKKNQIYGKKQKEIQTWLNSFGFNFQANHSILTTKEIDLYDEKINLAIEYCGLYWHNELSLTPRMSSYHFNKYKTCLEKGIRLITLFEDEWKNKNEQCKNIIKSILNLNSNKVYGRNCNLIECSKKEFKEFCDLYHLQGSNNLGKAFYGLTYQNNLIAGMSLGKHHRNKNILTLDRLCFKFDFNIIGGASKLFKACVKWAKNNNYKEIITWSDNRWSQGNVYKKLGFHLDENLPADYSYVEYEYPTQRISKQSQKKSNTNCPKNKTEHEWALERGFARIWDCGKIRWKYLIDELPLPL